MDDIDHLLTTERIGMQALSASPVGTWRVNAPGDAWWSAEMYEMFGVDPSQGVPPPETVFYLYHPDDTNLVGRAFKKTFTTDEPASVRYRVVRSDGRIRHVWQWGRRQPPDEKGEQCVVGVCVDITGEVVDSDGFETERAFRFVTEHSQDMVIRSQPDGVISYCSPASRSVVGYRPEELIGRTVMDFVAPEELERLNGIIQDRITRKKLVSRNGVEFRGLRKDGEPVWLESNPRLVLNGGGTLTEIVDVVRDVTARKTVEAELKAAREEALVAVAAKSEFIANMSHELRTPLTSILGFASLIGRDGGLTETDKGHLDLVRSAGETLLAVVNDILDFSRLEADAVTLCEAPFSVRELIEHTATLLHAQADKRGLFLDCRIDDDCWLIGDAPRLRQVMNNLVGNAVKFTLSGGVTIASEAPVGEDGRRMLKISVTDTGVGLDPKAIDRLFERFTQADGSVSRKFGGTGLGLAITRRLVELMHGQIGAFSDGMEGGSTFWFSVSLAETEPVVEVDATAGAEEITRPLHILLADDHPANRALVTALLAPLDIELDAVENGKLALEAAQTVLYDLILMDMQMPEMDGPAATRAIRALGGLVGETPIIALTANVMAAQIQKCRDAGMQGHVGKPINSNELYAAIGQYARQPVEGEAPVTLPA